MTDQPASGSAEFALARGREALAAGDRTEALRWLDRAHRLAPSVHIVTFEFASALIGVDDDRAAVLLRRLAELPFFWAAKIALAAVTLRDGDARRAATVLGAVLAQSAPPAGPSFRRLADDIARRAGFPGWIGMDSTGALTLSCQAQLRLDARNLRGPRLPAGWQGAAVLIASRKGAMLLGSPLDIRAHIAAEGFVRIDPAGGLAGWAWLPGHPETPARLCISAAGGEAGAIDIAAAGPAAIGGISSGRTFHIPLRQLPRGANLHVTGPDGADIFGSPVQIPSRPGQRRRVIPPHRPVDIVIPAYRNAASFRACLDSVRRSLPARTRIVAVDDATPEPALRAALAQAESEGVIVLRHARNTGFPGAANTGLRHAASGGPRDVVLLNPDTLLPRHWLKRLAGTAYSAAAIGSVTPLSNDGTIVSYPEIGQHAAAPDQAGTDRLDRICHGANAGSGAIELLTAVGFCMFIRHDCLAETGLLREDVFAQGYGEETDWCQRARDLGWRHVADPACFVAHASGQAFGEAKTDLFARNWTVLNRLHPGYETATAAFLAADPLAAARTRIDTARWRVGGQALGAVILVTHDLGGGVARHVAERARLLRAQGLRPILLRPSGNWPPEADAPRLCEVSDGTDEVFPNLRFDPASHLAALGTFLRPDLPRWIEIHHLVGHAPEIVGLAAALSIPFDITLHDYAAICPRISLCGGARTYCGEPVDIRDCEACIADHGERLGERISVADLRARSAHVMAEARMVVAPTQDAADRLARYIRPRRLEVRAWQTEPAEAMTPVPGDDLTICVVGAIGEEKGFAVLLACARDAARRGLKLRFALVGHSMDDSRLLDTGRVHITGEYAEAEAPALIAAQQAQLGLLPSVWPETWCYTLTALWQAGLWPTAFDLGAQGERIRRSGKGSLLPLGFPAPRINDFMLGLAHTRAGLTDKARIMAT